MVVTSITQAMHTTHSWTTNVDHYKLTLSANEGNTGNRGSWLCYITRDWHPTTHTLQRNHHNGRHKQSKRPNKYVSGDWPISTHANLRPHAARPHATRYSMNGASVAWRDIHPRQYTSRWLANSSYFGLLGSKVPQNGRFPAQDAYEPPCKIWRC